MALGIELVDSRAPAPSSQRLGRNPGGRLLVQHLPAQEFPPGLLPRSGPSVSAGGGRGPLQRIRGLRKASESQKSRRVRWATGAFSAFGKGLGVGGSSLPGQPRRFPLPDPGACLRLCQRGTIPHNGPATDPLAPRTNPWPGGFPAGQEREAGSAWPLASLPGGLPALWRTFQGLLERRGGGGVGVGRGATDPGLCSAPGPWSTLSPWLIPTGRAGPLHALRRRPHPYGVLQWLSRHPLWPRRGGRGLRRHHLPADGQAARHWL